MEEPETIVESKYFVWVRTEGKLSDSKQAYDASRSQDK
jgi:hypothetical protein